MSAVTLIVAALAALILLGVGHRWWRGAVLAAMYLLVFEGALRKWVFPAGQEFVYFAKDALLLGAYLRLVRDGTLNARSFTGAFGRGGLLLLLLGAAWVVVEMANPEGGGLAVGLFGFKAYFFAVPLVAVVPMLFPDRPSLIRFLWIYGALVIPTGLLATLQFFSPADSWVNTYAWGGDARVATFSRSEHVRVTSTFSYITPYSTYLAVIAPHLVSLLATATTRFRQAVLFGSLGLLGANLLMTGSRLPVFAAISGSIVVALSVRWLSGRRSVQLLLRAALGATILYYLVTAALPSSLEAFAQRLEETEDVEGRASSFFMAFVPLSDWGGLPVTWFGKGTGVGHQAAQHLNSRLGEMLPESEFARIGLELGAIGYLLMWLFRAALALRVVSVALRIHDPALRPLAASAAAVVLLNFPSGYVFSPTTQMLVYFLAGVPRALARMQDEAAT